MGRKKRGLIVKSGPHGEQRPNQARKEGAGTDIRDRVVRGEKKEKRGCFKKKRELEIKGQSRWENGEKGGLKHGARKK